MRVLVTGHCGHIGTAVTDQLRTAGHVVRGYDVSDGEDVRDRPRLTEAMTGCDGVVHLAAAQKAEEADIVDVNVVGSSVVLHTAAQLAVGRVVLASSVNALGIFMGQAPPAYLPINDDHPAHPRGAYGVSKLVMERMARRMVRERGTTVICLRPPAVLDDAVMRRRREQRRADVNVEWSPFWEYGAWIHRDDAAAAFVAALTCPSPAGGFAALLIAADDIDSDRFGARQLASTLVPDVSWRGGAHYETDPYHSLVECEPAKQLLGWLPVRRWADRDVR